MLFVLLLKRRQVFCKYLIKVNFFVYFLLKLKMKLYLNKFLLNSWSLAKDELKKQENRQVNLNSLQFPLNINCR